MGDQDRVYDDEGLGRYSSLSGLWRLDSLVDLPFQNDAQITFELVVESKLLPDSMPKNIHWFEEHMGEIWNAAAAVINELIEAEHIQIPPAFSLGHLWVFIPDAPLQTAEWRVEIEPKDMIESFEVVFNGLNILRYASLGP